MIVRNHTDHYRRDAEQFDYFAPRRGADLDATRRIRHAVLAALGRSHRSRVLDMGSGDGWLQASITGRGGDTVVVSCDLGVANLRKIRERHPDALVVAADANNLPFRPRSFDAVIASEVIEHLNDPGRALHAAYDVLRHPGRLVVSTPYREVLRYYLCIHCNQPTPVNAHLHSFDEHALRVFFDEAGFTSIRFETFQNKALVFFRISYLLRFLPWGFWRVIDRLCNFVYPKPHSIVMTGDRSEPHAP